MLEETQIFRVSFGRVEIKSKLFIPEQTLQGQDKSLLVIAFFIQSFLLFFSPR